MVAPAGEARSVITPLSVGRETADQISPKRGRTRAAYRAAGTTLPIADRTIRAVHRQRGSKIITAQNGKTRTLLNLKTNPISPSSRTSFIGFSLVGEDAGCCACQHHMLQMLLVSTSLQIKIGG